MKLPAAKDVHFDIDDYLNPFVPRSRISRLPKPLSRFLGYRDSPAPQVGNVLIATWALVGAFCGLTTVTAVYKFAPGISQYHPPVIIASLGAAAVLNYNVIQSPIAQPRNAVAGNTLAAITGVAIAKLFMLSPDFEDLRWLAGPLCCGAASWVMTLTNTVYPPGGATAILAATDPTVGHLGWMFVPVVLLGSIIMLGVALVTNNIQRQYPVFWWTPRDVGKQTRPDIESASRGDEKEVRKGEEGATLQREIVMTEHYIVVPEDFDLNPAERQLLESLRARLRNADRYYNPSEAPSDPESSGTLHSSRGILPSLKSQKFHEEP
ncbi:putative hpp family protein [Neofusicoccum parvum UCRNP2]|uniref:Putative hpp family protein n=1 Tax=Botryosphaeria parva (strain UCR-NP2) TaxID=1287680 RepID=R1EJI7_BOTPV|nr:putative hpp family protein [Neofusicoccum parvum UCRNP2]